MPSTCWTLIKDAASGQPMAAQEFVHRYEPLARQYLQARWRNWRGEADVDDALQEFFIECFRDGGVLHSVNDRPGEFRPFLFGVVRNVARRFEEKKRLAGLPEIDLVSDETGAGTAFDREWARLLMKDAAREMAELARIADAIAEMEANEQGRATRRVELLRQRFQDGVPIREIANQWQVDPAWLHHEYSTAREEFRVALHRVVSLHLPQATPAEVSQRCRDLLGLLG
jgi:RNA polymerase sigma factor (sigma-70 family)